MRYILFILLLSPVLTATTASGQDYYFALSYNTASPMGETSDFVDTYSWRGVSAEWRWLVNSNLSAGVFFGWNVFHNKITDDFEREDGDGVISGTQLRTINAFPILATGHYYFGNGYGDSILPYLGLGVGTYRTLQRTSMGIFQDEPKAWQFGFAPSVGIAIPVNYDLFANLEIRYNYALEAGDIPQQSYLGINLGLAWRN